MVGTGICTTGKWRVVVTLRIKGGRELAVGEMAYYGGMIGVIITVLMLIILSKIFAEQRQKMRDELNAKGE